MRTCIAIVLLTGSVYAAEEKPPYTDPVPHALITQPYRVCQDLEELTARIDNLYRKPYHKVLDAHGVMQPETIYFKDTVSGHEVAGLTRELCADMAHGDLGRPAWTCDGSRILFMGTRGFRQPDGSFKFSEWGGHKYIMNADYSAQRALMVQYKDKFVDKDGKEVTRSAGIYGKYNIMDPENPRLAYYAVNDKFWRVTLAMDDTSDQIAELFCPLATPHNKFIQDISADGKVLIQDANADPDKKTGALPYMPEIHVIDTAKKPGAPGFYYHHPMDYGLPDVTDESGKIIHSARNNYQLHSLMFSKTPQTVGFNYGPMTDVGEYLGWTLDISNGLDGAPTHGKVVGGAGANPWGQYESHGRMIGGGSTLGLYFGGPVKQDGKESGGWGIYVRDYANDNAAPRFITKAAGGHIAGGESKNPYIWAAHIGAGFKDVKENDAIVWGDAREGTAAVLCYTYSEVRGGIKTDRATQKKSWTGPDTNDARPYSSIPRPILSPDATKLMFHSCMLDPTEDWVGMYVAVTQRPEPPRELKAADGAKSVQLQWQMPAVAHELKCFHLYRGDKAENMAEIATLPARDKDDKPQLAYTDASAQDAHTYTYALTSEEWSTLESDRTSNALVVKLAAGSVSAENAAPLKGWDKTPPAPVKDFKAALETDEHGQYLLTWQAAPEKDLRYYNIYFSTKGQPEVSQKRLIASPLAGMTRYLDWTAPVGTDVYYAITAVDRQGNESAPAFVELKKTGP